MYISCYSKIGLFTLSNIISGLLKDLEIWKKTEKCVSIKATVSALEMEQNS